MTPDGPQALGCWESMAVERASLWQDFYTEGEEAVMCQPQECLCGPASLFAFVSSHTATSTQVMPGKY